jgi:cytochrome P450
MHQSFSVDTAIATIADPRAHGDRPRLEAAYAWLRQNAPLAETELPGHDPFRAVTKHADILAISRDNKLFPFGDHANVLLSKEGVVAARAQPARTLVQMDEPDHKKYRQLTQSWFMPKNVKVLESRIRELARQSVNRMADLGGACDFANDVALHYPLHVIMEIFGVPAEDEGKMLTLTQELLGSTDPDLQRTSLATEGTSFNEKQMAVMMEFFLYFNLLIEARREEPRQDVASVIANSTVDGEPIPMLEAVSYFLLLATAGHDTTSATVAGALGALATRPDQFARLKSDLSLIPSFVEESIRWVTPVRHFMRSASEDTELRGHKIPKGSWLMLCYPSGNRDEEVFEAPHEFRVDRTPNNHLAFGYGPHMCLGLNLARMEMRILWEEMLPRLEDLALAGEEKYSEGIFVSRPKALPISYRLG